jgi:hypothetical protein
MSPIKTTPIDAFEDRVTRAGPKVNYNEALNLYMFTQSGQVTTVRAASPKDMQRLITQALATLEHPGECKRQLKGLDLQDLICKWYCIDTLKTYKAKVAVFATAEEALK